MADNGLIFDLSELVKLGEGLKVSQGSFKGDAFLLLQRESTKLRRAIKTAMPVDTGAARYSWGSIPAGPVAAKKGLEGIWKEDKAALEITQGSQRDQYNYINRLNEGYSKQAPAGFIDDEQMKAEDALDEAINGLLGSIL